MQLITDNTGNTWTLAVNVNTLRRVKALCNIQLTDLIVIEQGKNPDATLLERLAADPILLVDTLYAIVKPEADQKGISDEAFGAAMVGDTLDQAINALLDEVIAFFPSAKRQVLSKILTASRRFAKTQQQTLNKMLDDPTLDKAIEQALTESSV